MTELPLPDEWTELPGDWQSRRDEHQIYQGVSGLFVSQRIRPGLKIGAIVPVTHELLADTADIKALIHATMDQYFRPWLYPDRYQWPMFDPFPRITRILGWVRHPVS